MLLVHDGKDIYLERRPSSGIWGGLWSLPEVTDAQASEDWCNTWLDASTAEVTRWQILRHGFSHYDLDIEPIEVRIDVAASTLASNVADNADKLWHPLAQAADVGLPAPVRALLEQL